MKSFNCQKLFQSFEVGPISQKNNGANIEMIVRTFFVFSGKQAPKILTSSWTKPLRSYCPYQWYPVLVIARTVSGSLTGPSANFFGKANATKVLVCQIWKLFWRVLVRKKFRINKYQLTSKFQNHWLYNLWTWRIKNIIGNSWKNFLNYLTILIYVF